MIDKKLYNDLLNKKYPDVITDTENDKDILTIEDVEGLHEYERTHANRMQLLDYFKILKKSLMKNSKINKKEDTKMSEETKGTGLNVVLTPAFQANGISLPQRRFPGVTISKRRPLRVSKEAVDYIKKTYDKNHYLIMSDAEMKKKQDKKDKEATKENK